MQLTCKVRYVFNELLYRGNFSQIAKKQKYMQAIAIPEFG